MIFLMKLREPFDINIGKIMLMYLFSFTELFPIVVTEGRGVFQGPCVKSVSISTCNLEVDWLPSFHEVPIYYGSNAE